MFKENDCKVTMQDEAYNDMELYLYSIKKKIY